jgi:hypothetical protein
MLRNAQMTTVLIKKGSYRNEPVINQTFELVKEFQVGAKGGYVTVKNVGQFAIKIDVVKVKVNEQDIVVQNGAATNVVVQPKPVVIMSQPAVVNKGVKTKAREAVSKTVKQIHAFAKDLKPKDSDAMYYGTEPLFETQPIDEKRDVLLTRAMNWYSHFYLQADAKSFLLDYLEANHKTSQLKLVRKAPDNRVSTSCGWLARLARRGLMLTPREITRIDDEVTKLVALVKPDEDETVKVERKSIQEIMRERAGDAAAELDEMFDEFVKAKHPKEFDVKTRVMTELKNRNILPQHVTGIIKYWEKLLSEYVELQAGKNKQLLEGYAHLSKTDVKNTIKFIETTLAELNGYCSIKKTIKRVRVKKAVPVSKIVAKLKHLKTFKDGNLELTGLSPEKLHGAAEAFIYDTAKRKLHHYVVDTYNKGFVVKGNTLVGFDEKASEIKTIRKPAEQLKEILGAKPAAKKFFKEIKSVGVSPSGRFNENMIILRCY